MVEIDDNKQFKVSEDSAQEKGILTTNDGTVVELNYALEKKLVWKFDLKILPVLAVMYLFNSLDKSNLGNAKTHGLEHDLHMVGQDYNLVLSLFFVPYVLTAPFLGIAGKKYGPNRVLPCMMAW